MAPVFDLLCVIDSIIGKVNNSISLPAFCSLLIFFLQKIISGTIYSLDSVRSGPFWGQIGNPKSGTKLFAFISRKHLKEYKSTLCLLSDY